MRSPHILFGLCALLIFTLAAAHVRAGYNQRELERAGVLLYISFDNGSKPDFYRGEDPERGITNKAQIATSVIRNGAVADRLRYVPDGNLDATRGTIAFHARVADGSGSFMTVFSREWGFYHWQFTLHKQDQWLRPWVLDRAGFAVGREFDASTIDVTQWHHYAITWDRMAGTRFYVDGKLASEEYGHAGWAKLLTPHVIDFRPRAGIDELFIMDRPLDEAQIAALMEGRFTPPNRQTHQTPPAILDQLGFTRPGSDLHTVGGTPLRVEQVRIDRAKSGTITMTWVHDGREHPAWCDVYADQTSLDIYPERRAFNYITLDGFLNQTRLAEYDEQFNVERPLMEVGEGVATWAGKTVPASSRRRLVFHRNPNLTGEEKNRVLHEIRLFDVQPWAAGYSPDPSVIRRIGADAGEDLPALGFTGRELLRVVPPSHRNVRLMSESAGEDVGIAPMSALRLIDAERTQPLPVIGVWFDLAIKSSRRDDVLQFVVREPCDAGREIVRFPAKLAPDARRITLMLQTHPFMVNTGERAWIEIHSTRGDLVLDAKNSRMALIPGDAATVRRQAVDDLFQVAHKLFAWSAEGRPWGRDFQNELLSGSYGGYEVRELDRILTKILKLDPGHVRARITHREIHAQPLVTQRIDDHGSAGAPAWAGYAREVLRSHLRRAHWWLDNRMMSDGQLGGNWNDDPCLTSYFAITPLLGDRKSLELVQRVADGYVDNSGDHVDGFNRRLTDYLHSSDPTAGRCNLLTFDYGRPRNIQRAMEACRQLAVFLPPLPGGKRSLAGHDIASGVVSGSPWVDGWIFNVFSDMVAWAWYSGDANVTRQMLDMADTWLDASREYWEKNPNELNMAIAVNGQTGEWRPGSKSGQNSREQFMFTAYALSGDRKYLQPIERRKISPMLWALETPVDDWKGYNPRAVADQTLRQDRTTYRASDQMEAAFALAFVQTGDKRYLAEGLRICLEELQAGQEYLDTAAEKPTDRVFGAPGADLLGLMYCHGKIPDDRSALVGSVRMSWDSVGDQVVAAVNRADGSSAHITVYSFAPSPVTVGLRLWRMDRGDYQVTVGQDADRDDFADAVGSMTQAKDIRRGSRIELTIPPGQSVVEITRLQPLPPLPAQLPDVAVMPGMVRYDADTDSLIADIVNLGSADAKNVTVSLYADDQLLRKQVFEIIAWPGDFHLKPARIRYPQGATLRATEIRVEVSCEGEEITRENNDVTVRYRR